jgi:23S rRNA pseudouridine1911/1915/1917 synthase
MKITVAPRDAGVRLDLLVGVRTGLPRRRLAALFAGGLVRRNGRRAAKGETTDTGDVVEIDDGALDAPAVAPAPGMALEVAYEDAHLAVVIKPAGVPTHPNRPGEQGTLAGAIAARWPEVLAVGARAREPGLVHRLDTGTSGLLLVARTQAAYAALRGAFAAGAVAKEYVAAVEGRPPSSGSVGLPIAHHPKNTRKMIVVEPGRPSGRSWPAETRWEVSRRGARGALLRVSITGGVMHQIRVHLAHAGFPVAGDALYGSAAAVPGGRFLLHASRVSLAHPATGAPLACEAPPPPEFAVFIDQ